MFDIFNIKISISYTESRSNLQCVLIEVEGPDGEHTYVLASILAQLATAAAKMGANIVLPRQSAKGNLVIASANFKDKNVALSFIKHLKDSGLKLTIHV